MSIARWFRHVFRLPGEVRRLLDAEALDAIEQAVNDVESRHSGEIRVAIESSLDVPDLWQGVTPRRRALQAFGSLGVWDTERNNGVLIYVLVADHDVEIVADRGISARVSQDEWNAICRLIQTHCRQGRYRDGLVEGVRSIGEVLARHFPNEGGDRDEQPNRPVLI